MANIIEAERQRRGSDDAGSENTLPVPRTVPIKKPAILRKKKPKLTDLNVDDATDTDSEEYKGTSGEEEEEEPDPSEDEYLPSDFERRRRSKRGGRTQSDDDFIDDSGSDYEPNRKQRKSGYSRQSQRKLTGKRK